MKIEQIYTGCLAQGAYYIESNGEVAIIDPLREVQPYIEKAQADGAKIKYVLETHFHADFVSGHIDLAQKTNSQIVYGPLANPKFDAMVASDGQILPLGNVKIKVLHTPGHTMESTCFLLLDENDQPHALFTGDTLFIGDVGRPDLAQKAASMTQEQLAETLFDSLRNKIMPLPDQVIVYPGHGAGSACGKNMSKETVSSIGEQKQMNYALRANMSKEEFVKEVTDGLMPPPAYFPMNVRMNKEGYEKIDQVIEKGNQALDPQAFEDTANATEALMLDVRNAQVFAKGYIPNAINIGLDGQFAPWVGALIPDGQPILLITDSDEQAHEAVIRLARVGYDNTIGFLKGGFQSWADAGKEVETVHSISAQAFAEQFDAQQTVVIDVRREGEFEAEHVENAQFVPLDYFNQYLDKVPKDKHFFLHCAGGYRSMIAASILKARGWDNFTDVAGGFGAIAKTEVPRTDFVCPSQKKVLN